MTAHADAGSIQCTCATAMACRARSVEAMVAEAVAGMGIPTPLRATEFQSYLEGYPQKDYIVEGISHGFSIGFNGQLACTEARNSPTVTDNLEVVLNLVKEESELGVLRGHLIQFLFIIYMCHR